MKNTTLPSEIQMQQNERILRNYALQLTQNMDDANDLVQETFLKAMLYSSKFKEGTNLKEINYRCFVFLITDDDYCF